jgi:hypothetical protein
MNSLAIFGVPFSVDGPIKVGQILLVDAGDLPHEEDSLGPLDGGHHYGLVDPAHD